jgi:flavin reductase (DIM6/NTAB) family NADH-FMN oxidoreductase RutF
MKKDVSLSKAHRLINHGPVTLVTSQIKNGSPNVLAVAWNSPLSQNPPLVGISIASAHFSHQLIVESHEFTINIPSTDLIHSVYTVGKMSGKDGDKFSRAKLTPVSSQIVMPPLIEECIGHLECRVNQMVEVGDHTWFVGEVLRACAEENYFQDRWDLDKDGGLHHLGGEWFSVSGELKRAELL